MTLALIDGDIVAYRAAVGLQRNHKWGDGVVSSDVNPHEAAEAALQTIATWLRLAKCSDCIVCFTGRHNFRKRILPTYKANRAGAVKPIAYLTTVERITNAFLTRVVDGLEADDLLGILATREAYSDAIVVTVDKDLRGVPGRHFNPLKDTKPTLCSESAADAQWLMQALMGDTSDGYTGIPRVGPAKAAAFLGGDVRTLAATKRLAKDLWPHVVAAYAKHKLTEKDALIQARVARILRNSDYDNTTKEVILWHPRTPERLPLLPTPASNATTAGPAIPPPPPAPLAGTSTSNDQ